MKFGKSLLLWLIVLLALAGALVATRVFKPANAWQSGDLLFPVDPEAIVAISMSSPSGALPPITLERTGEFWRLRDPIEGALCSAKAVADLLDALQALRVVTPLGEAALSGFTPWRTVEVRTAEGRFTCGLGRVSEAFTAPLSQVLAERDGRLIAVEAGAVMRLPETAEALRTNALLPVTSDRLQAIEWHLPGHPFSRAERLPNGHWQVTRPFPFEPQAEPVRKALECLTAPGQLRAYLLPTPTERVPNSEQALADYGLDEERALRLTFRVSGLREPLTLRIGKADPKRPGLRFCLLDNARAIGCVPDEVAACFSAAGPFSTDFRNLPLLGDLPAPTELDFTLQATDLALSLRKQGGAWQMLRPLALPANAQAVQALLQQLMNLTGDLAGLEAPEGTPWAEVTLRAASANTPEATLQFFGDPEAERIQAYRVDHSRLYRLRREALPELLRPQQAPDLALRQALIDPTLLALPAAAIRRISLLRRDGSAVTLSRAPDTLAWEVEAPIGAFLNTQTLDAWLAAFADLKAEAILCDAPTTFGALRPYGLETPLLRLTIDLDGREGPLRRVLSIGTPDPKTGSAPALIQGCPVLYRIGPETLRLLQLPPLERGE
ncbi:MAG: DUF4340 domain-containing protein [Candidatus Spyradenecus sp.]